MAVGTEEGNNNAGMYTAIYNVYNECDVTSSDCLLLLLLEGSNLEKKK